MKLEVGKKYRLLDGNIGKLVYIDRQRTILPYLFEYIGADDESWINWQSEKEIVQEIRDLPKPYTVELWTDGTGARDEKAYDLTDFLFGLARGGRTSDWCSTQRHGYNTKVRVTVEFLEVNNESD